MHSSDPAAPPCGVCDKTARPPRHVMPMRGNPANGGWCNACKKTPTPATGAGGKRNRKKSPFSRHEGCSQNKKQRRATTDRKVQERGHSFIVYMDAAGGRTTISDSIEDDPDFDPDLDDTGTAGRRSRKEWANLANRRR